MVRVIISAVGLLLVFCSNSKMLEQKIDILDQKIDQVNYKLDLAEQWQNAVVKGNGLDFENTIKTK